MPSGWGWNGSQSGQDAAELGFPGPMLWKMQCEPARRASEPSGQGKDPSSEGLGGHDLLTQADAGCPASQVVRYCCICWVGAPQKGSDSVLHGMVWSAIEC